MSNTNNDFFQPISVFFYLWMVASVVSSLYAYTWDIKMDWGLLDKNAEDNKFLREEIVYSSKGYYYFAIIEDLILRFGWTASVTVSFYQPYYNDVVTSILAVFEVFRRFVWNFFRLENEHLNNCGKYIFFVRRISRYFYRYGGFFFFSPNR